jgi:DNA polymerase elongation subunit (family B)
MEFPRKESVIIDGHDAPLRFQITDVFVPEADKSKRILNRDPNKRTEFDFSKDPEDYKIILYGCTEEGHSVCAEVTNYCPYFYLRIPQRFAKMGTLALKNWVNDFKMFLLEGSYQDARYFKQYGKPRQVISKWYKSQLVSVKLEYRKEFMGFTNNEDFPFLKVTVKSLTLFNNLRYFFQNPPQEFLQKYKEPFKLYESNIDPMLRFIHDRSILPCGWVELPAKCYSLLACGTEDDSYCRTNFTVEVHYKYVKPLENNSTAPLTIVSFDLECTSSHGDFPVAIKDYLKLAKDLMEIGKYMKFTKEELMEWILQAYEKDVLLNASCKIHRLYMKEKIDPVIIRKKLGGIMDTIMEILGEVRKHCGVGEDDGEEEEEDAAQNKKGSKYEWELKNILTKFLPKLHGDAIIQIGTTVHRYGSDEIIYKNIITLKSCDSIEGTDVQSYQTEEEVLYAWKELIRRLDPDILMGYNIFGFDMPYVWDRATELGLDNYGVGLGRLSDRECVLIEQRLSSAALGDNVLKYFDMDGVVMIDMYKVMQRTPLDSYKLDFVAQLYLGDQKNDLKPFEIFEKYKGNSHDRKVIAEYCIQDCALVNRLFHKLKVLENNNAMGNVCLVPLSYLFMRGQGVKIFSLVAQFCKNENFAIPVLKNFRDDIEEDDSGYEGAIVLNPKEGIYLEDSITVLDYSSLYPSSMIERNLSHDCYVNDPAYDNLPDVDYLPVTYDIYEGVGDKKKKVGEKQCKFVQLPNKEKGVIPRILMKLLTQRKNTRKKMEYETITTKTGEKFTGIVKENDTNVIITDVEKKQSWTIDKETILSREDTYNNFEKLVFDALQLAYKVTANSLYGQIGSRVSPIYLKDIAACTTATGRERIMMAKKFVEEKYGAEVIYGDSVTGYTPITLKVHGVLTIDKMEDLAKKYGKNHWIPCIEEGRQEKEACEIPEYVEVWTDQGWTPICRVIRHTLAPHKQIIRVLTHTGVVDVTDDHSLLLSDKSTISPKDIQIGTSLLHAAISDSKCWKESLQQRISHWTSNYGNNDNIVIEMDNMISAQSIFLLGTSIGYKASINTRSDKPNVFRITFTKGNQRRDPTVVKKLHNVDYHGYVYDLTTVNHHFQAGIGNMIVHNTDSIFCKFPFKDENGNPIHGKATLPLGIMAGQKASHDIKSIMPEPQSLEYEKTFFPFIIFSKKRYVGLLYEDDANKKPKQKSMGIVLKRRDNAPLVKKIYGGIIDILLNKYDLHASVEFLTQELKKLVEGKYPLEDLVITKTLKGNYVDRTKIAHCVLADRMGERDAGNKPQINDRIPYIYIQTNGEVKLQGDRIEHPEYIREKSLTPDYQFYITNQLMKPICQIYALCVEKLPNYAYSPGYWEQWDEELRQNKIYADSEIKRKNRIDALREQEVESLLFSPFLEKKRKVRSLAAETKAETKTTKKKAVIQKYTLALDAPKLIFSITEDKENKQFKGKLEFLVKHDVKLEKNIVLPKKKLTKTDACNRMMYDILKDVLKDYEPDITAMGLQLQLDKYYTRVLKTALEEHETIMDKLQEAQKEGDMEMFEKYTEMLKSIAIAQAIYKYKHNFV